MDIPGIYFHLYNKGVENRIIFADKADYEVFLKYMREYLSPARERSALKTTFEINGHEYKGVPHLPKNYHKDVELIAFNLSPHHYHLLVKENTPGTLGKFMRSLCTRYAIYYNNKYNHEGSIFQGTYIGTKVPDSTHVKLLTYYLHHGGTHTSLPFYFAPESTNFPSVDATLAFLDMSKQQYVQFMNSEALEEGEMSMLHSTLIPCGVDHLGRKNLTSPVISHKKRQQNIFLTFALFGFILLTSISTRNILHQRELSEVQTINTPSIAPSAIPTAEPYFAQQESAPDVLAAHDPQELLLIKLRVTIVGEALRVNIRSNPLPDASIIAKAYNGDLLDAVEKVDDWYAIKLPDGNIGYILGSNVVEIK